MQPHQPYSHATHHRRQAVARRTSSARTLGLALGIVPVALGLLGVVVGLVRGPEVLLHNNRTAEATVVVDDEELLLAPGQWAEVHVPNDEVTALQATFADGSTQEIEIDTRYGDCRRDYRAYALGAEHCYAMVDVTAFYEGSDPISILQVYRDRADLEFGVTDRCEDEAARARYGARISGAQYLDPGEDLPDKLYAESGDRVVRLYAVDCDDSGPAELLASLQR